MPTSSSAGSLPAVPPAAVPHAAGMFDAACGAEPPGQRLFGDLAAVILCAAIVLRPLFAGGSMGAVVASAAIACSVLLTVLHGLRIGRAWRPSLLLLVGVFLWIVGTLIAARNGWHPAGLDQSMRLWGEFAVATAAIHRLAADGHRRRLLLQALIVSAALLAVYALEEHFLERPLKIWRFDHDPAFQSASAADVRALNGQERFFNPRINGAFPSANLMGAVFAVGALLSFAWAWWQALGRRRWHALWAAAWGLLMLVCLHLTGSKGALLGFLCGGGVALALAGSQAPPAARNRRRATGALLAAILGAVLLLPVAALAVPIDGPLDFHADHTPEGAFKSALVRIDYWQTGWRMWRSAPMGIGPDQTQQVFSRLRSPWALETPIDLHHEFFELLVETGPLALLGALAAFGWILVRGLRAAHLDVDPEAEAAAPPEPSTPANAPPALHANAPPAAASAAAASEPTLFLPLPVLTAWVIGGAWLFAMTVGWAEANSAIQPANLLAHSPDSIGLLPRLCWLAAVCLSVVALTLWIGGRRAPAPPSESTATAPNVSPDSPAKNVAPFSAGFDRPGFLRAAALGGLVIVLVHSGFDFVLQNGAVLLLAATCAGLATAATACERFARPSTSPASTPAAGSVPHPTVPPPTVALPSTTPADAGKARLKHTAPGFGLALCALAVGWLAVIRPLRLEWAQAAADRAQENLAEAEQAADASPAKHLPPADAQALTQAVQDNLDACTRVLAAAPDSMSAVVGVHQAILEAMAVHRSFDVPAGEVTWLDGRTLRPEDVLQGLGNYITSLNPIDSTRWFYAGRVDLTLRGIIGVDHDQDALHDFQRSAELDPQRPMLHLMIGDCKLSMGYRHEAALAYQAAWQAQWSGSVPESQFYCLYYDAAPSAEILPPTQTGWDKDFTRQPSLLLHDLDKIPVADQVALLRRYWVALRAVQIAEGPAPVPADPTHPTADESAAILLHTAQANAELATLQRILALRPDSVDTELLLTLRGIALAPPGSLDAAAIAARFAALRKTIAGSQVDRPLPGVIERIADALEHPPRERYHVPPPPSPPADESPPSARRE